MKHTRFDNIILDVDVSLENTQIKLTFYFIWYFQCLRIENKLSLICSTFIGTFNSFRFTLKLVFTSDSYDP